MDLIFEIYKSEEGGLCADARGLSLSTKGDDLGQLLTNIEKVTSAHFEDDPNPPGKISCVWRDPEDAKSGVQLDA